MEEVVVAIGLNRARIRLGKWVHLKLHFHGLTEFARGSESTKVACRIFVNNGPPPAAFFVAGTNQLDTKANDVT
jgi:hypothetical protein